MTKNNRFTFQGNTGATGTGTGGEEMGCDGIGGGAQPGPHTPAPFATCLSLSLSPLSPFAGAVTIITTSASRGSMPSAAAEHLVRTPPCTPALRPCMLYVMLRDETPVWINHPT